MTGKTKNTIRTISNFGFSFPWPFLIFGWGLSIGGLFGGISLLVSAPIFAPTVIPLILGGMYLSLTVDKSQYHPEKRACRNCSNFIGFSKGDWKYLEDYPYIGILKQNWVSNTYSRSNRQISVEEVNYDICLMDSKQWDKIILNRCKGLQEAEVEAKRISALINIPIVDYQPYISERSKARRR